MSLAGTLRKAIAVADNVVKSLEEEVYLSAWTGQTGFGVDVYADPVPLKAIVEHKLQMYRASDGQMIGTKTKLTFIKVIAPNGASGRNEPIDSRDLLVCFDGSTGPILVVDGMRDAEMHRPFMLEVYLG